MSHSLSAEKAVSGRSALLRSAPRRVLSFALLLFAVFLSWRTAWVVSYTLLDSDASSNLVLAAKLAREGGILSSTFIYSTELHVVHSQLIHSLLFRFCSDWSLVRFLGAVIMQALMLGAYGYLARQARMPFNAFCVTAAVMLLPFSVPYGRIVLYHNYYIPYITLDLWMIGLFLSATRRIETARQEGFRSILGWALPSVLLGPVAFAAGLSGVRHLMICAAPLLVSALLCALGEEKAEDANPGSRLGEAWPSLLVALGMTLCCTLGYLVNTRVLANRYTFTNYSNQTLSLVSVNGLEAIFRGFLTAIGYQESLPLFSLHGLLAVGNVVAVMIALILGCHTLRHTRDRAARFLQVFMLVNLLVITCVFAFLSNTEFTYELYYLPVLFWIVPALGKAELRSPEDASPSAALTRPARMLGAGSPPLSVHGLAAMLACALLISSGVYYSCFFRNPDQYASEVDYSGLLAPITHDPFTVQGLQPVADYLKTEGYTLCYAAYWDGAVVTELTDGQVSTVPIEPGSRRKAIQYQKWLTDTLLWDPENIRDRRACILANYDLASALEGADAILDSAVEQKTIGGYVIYELTDPTVIARYLE